MGSLLSSVMGGQAAAALATPPSPENQPIVRFRSAPSWKLHFNSFKESPMPISWWCISSQVATYSGPCKMMKPVFMDMHGSKVYIPMLTSSKSTSMSSLSKCLKDVAGEFGVEATPTFVLFKRGKEKERVVGAKIDELDNKINQNRAISS